MKLVLHIGTEKTGTTSIQKWLYSNRARLSWRGIYLSNILDKPNNRALAHAFQDSDDLYHIVNGIDTSDKLHRFRNTLLRDLELEVKDAKKKHRYMVISSEHLQSRLLAAHEVEMLSRFMSRLFYDITVVCYLRHQVEMRRSIYSTLVRQGYTAPLDEFDVDIDERSPYYNHLALVQRWGGAFGKDNLLLRDYAKTKLHGGDVVGDFLTSTLVNLDPRGLDFSATLENPGLSRGQFAAYRLINKFMRYSDEKGGVKRANLRAKRLADLVLDAARIRAKGPAITQKEREISRRIEERFADSNRRLSKEYFFGNLFSGYKS